MKTIYYILLSFALIGWSCQRTDLIGGDEIVEGEKARVSITIDDRPITRSGMSQSQEQTINNIYVMVFDKKGTMISKSFFSSNITQNLQNIATVSGTNMSVYVVANLSNENTLSSSVDHFFDNIHTVDELNHVMIYNLASDLSVNRDLVMYGSVTGLVISPSATQNVTIQLNYAVAKVTLYVVQALTNAGDSYHIPNWTVNNYPQKSYLFAQSADAGNPTVNSDFQNSPTSISWVDTTIMISGVSTQAKYAFLYMYENRRGTNNNTLETQKATNVPAKSTAMVLNGYYRVNNSATVQGVTTTIYLGNNNFNDYNVNRSNEYSYIMTVKSINNINIDSRVVSNSSGYQVNIFNTTLDCHPDRRPVQLIAWSDTYTLQILDASGNPATTGFWLKASNIDLNKAVLRSGSYQRPLYTPATDMVYNMVLNYTGNPTSSPTTNMLYIYADENTTQVSRSGYVQVTSSTNDVVKIPITQLGYQIMGNVGFRAYNVNGTTNSTDDYMIAIENKEEITMNITPGATTGTESLNNMQWGFNNIASQPTAGVSANYQYRNGFVNTVRGVYGNTTGVLASTLIAPYGRISTTSSTSTSTTTTEQLHNPIFNSYPLRYCFEKNRDLDGDGKITNPNTQGTNEINWYLPATEELMLIGVGQAAYSNQMTTPGNYGSSSEIVGTTTDVQYYVSSTGVNMTLSKYTYFNARCIRKMYQTQPQATKNSPYVETGTRIINATGFNASALRTTNLTCPTPLHDFPSTIGQQISKRFVVSAVDVKLNGATGSSFLDWAQGNGFTSASNSSSTSFVIASPATGCQAYSEAGAPLGTWRLPTLKELQIIFLMKNELVAQSGNGLVAFSSNAWYQSSTFGSSTNSMICFIGTTHGSAFATKVSPTPIRCIHDL